MTISDWDDVLDVNLKTVFFLHNNSLTYFFSICFLFRRLLGLR